MDGESVRCSRCAALRVLELERDATGHQIRTAYRLLVKVWHPDRFQGDAKLKQAAEDKLKGINAAYVFLSSASGSSKGQPWRRAPARAAPREQPAKTKPAAKREAAAWTGPSVHVRWNVSPWLWAAIRSFSTLALVALVILLGRYAWIAFDVPAPASEEVARVYDSGEKSVLSSLEAPRRRFIQAVERDLERLGLGKPSPELPAIPPADRAAKLKAGSRATGKAAAATSAAPAFTPSIQPYITAGLSKDEVLAIAGPPTASSADKLVYQGSEIDFKDGRVAGWKIDPASAPLRVKLWPDAPVDAGLQSFTVGSSKNEVLAVQGTPTAFSEDRFGYGGSEVYFENGRVVRWQSDPASAPLRAHLPQ